ncbi:MAG: 3-phosphoglycerate dehydrogenase family protein [Lachnospiraceae bacterium]
MYQYHCLNPIANVGLDLFDDKYEKVEDMKEAQGILLRSASMHEMELPKHLATIARAGAGVNNIPLEQCAQEGIVVFNTPGANANGVKELVFAGMLMASRDITGGIQWVLENKENANVGKEAESAKKAFAGCEIAGKTLGVIGLGAIGVKVANAATHLGMTVYGYDPFISVNAAWSLSRNVKHISTVEEIYTECDYITVHVPLLENTKKMLNQVAFEQMKDGVVILNFARDLLVDEEAILAAIKKGKVKKYVSDFPNATTAGQKGCIVIPHLGASTEESEDNCAVMAVKEMKDYLENGNIRNSVNYPNCNMGICQEKGRVGILHKNIKGIISKYSAILENNNINISDLMNKSRGNYAYSLLDIDTPITGVAVTQLGEIEGVLRVRVIK